MGRRARGVERQRRLPGPAWAGSTWAEGSGLDTGRRRARGASGRPTCDGKSGGQRERSLYGVREETSVAGGLRLDLGSRRLGSFPTQALAHPSQGDAGRPTAGGAVRMRDAGSEAEGGHLRTISKYAMTNPNSSTIKYSIFADLFLIVP